MLPDRAQAHPVEDPTIFYNDRNPTFTLSQPETFSLADNDE